MIKELNLEIKENVIGIDPTSAKFGMALVKIPTKCRAPLHYHLKTKEIYILVKGRMGVILESSNPRHYNINITLNDIVFFNEIFNKEGNLIIIPQNKLHFAYNPSSKKDLEFLCLSFPKWNKKDYYIINN